MENDKRERDDTEDKKVVKTPRHEQVISGRNKTVLDEALKQFETISRNKPVIQYLRRMISGPFKFGCISVTWWDEEGHVDPATLLSIEDVNETHPASPKITISLHRHLPIPCYHAFDNLVGEEIYQGYLPYDRARNIWPGTIAVDIQPYGLHDWQKSEKQRYTELTKQLYAANTPLSDDTLMCVLSFLVYD